jgi:uncharacterized protein YcfJ
MNYNTIAQALFATTALAFAAQASAQVSLFEQDGFQGRSFSTQQRAANLDRSGLNDRASSVIVTGPRWQVCDEARFQGRCTVFRPGQYPSLSALGLNDRISSLRPLAADERVAEADYAPMPMVTQDFRRRGRERLYDANVTSAHAVLGTPGQRCWTEREQVVQQPQQGNLNLAGAAVGAVIGGILGHQVGGGTGKQIATVGGAVGGAALGAQYGRNDAPASVAHDVRRCDSHPEQATPSYWDVTYDFRGQQHHMQTATDPGRTVTVNRAGEPRI